MQTRPKRQREATAPRKRKSLTTCLRMPRTFCVAMFFALIAGSANSPASDGAATGNKPGPQAKELLMTFWNQVKDADTKGLEAGLDPSWQVARADGSYMDKSEFLVKVGNGKIDLDSFKFGPMKTTRHGSSLVVRYMATAEYTIKGSRYKGTPAPYLATFIRQGGRWLMTSQANFDLPAK
jgi:Domain of unknown function (DUF4440)